ncbi:MAG: hypothetical protein R3D71_05545 [Rickettsiales bacterium]
MGKLDGKKFGKPVDKFYYRFFAGYSSALVGLFVLYFLLFLKHKEDFREDFSFLINLLKGYFDYPVIFYNDITVLMFLALLIALPIIVATPVVVYRDGIKHNSLKKFYVKVRWEEIAKVKEDIFLVYLLNKDDEILVTLPKNGNYMYRFDDFIRLITELAGINHPLTVHLMKKTDNIL